MKIAIASDHRGYEAKRRLMPEIQRQAHEILDFGCDGPGACDYPDFAAVVARAVAAGEAEAGILLDGSGIGMTVAANKVCGVRAALAHDEVTARRSREHNHCNVLCIASDLLSEEQVKKIVNAFLSTGFGSGRHERRIRKIDALDQEQRGPVSKLRQVIAPVIAAPVP